MDLRGVVDSGVVDVSRGVVGWLVVYGWIARGSA